jgi:hypothetical protein
LYCAFSFKFIKEVRFPLGLKDTWQGCPKVPGAAFFIGKQTRMVGEKED